ncbi:YicC/YloC family endoribonuclease [Litoribrevibacter euphylliae]|uniref:YicC/YloC family endoribonuclease n=1 Tax=Litoribrevibacter euphylliae TaxID=1834034 RepID=A0ABV7HM74_9GAMM
MTRSMTAFARAEGTFEWGSLTWELKSVNHRYLEVYPKLAEGYRDLEQVVRETVRKYLNRGKVELQLKVQTNLDASAAIEVDSERAQEVITALSKVNEFLPKAGSISPSVVLNWPGVQVLPELDRKAILADAARVLNDALEQLKETRAREGAELKTFIKQRLESVADITTQVRAKMPDILQRQRENLQEKLNELSGELDNQRVEQEIVLLTQKADVDEEVDRLDAHVTEVTRVLDQKGPVGRRLDFLMQEMNREANTLSSKSIVTETTQCAVELKVLIEQMREQIQNIE